MCDSVMVKYVCLLNSKGELDVNLHMLFLDRCYKEKGCWGDPEWAPYCCGNNGYLSGKTSAGRCFRW